MRLLVVGAGGMLGQDLLRAAERGGHEPVAMTRGELDITDAAAVAAALASAEPDAVLNCAAWTDVDGAESQPQAAYAVNATGAGVLAAAAAEHRVPLLHVSTDYVFDGDAPRDAAGRLRAYVESDPTGPRSV
jgi:dTDP-4-dehydrorhamnose reductase